MAMPWENQGTAYRKRGPDPLGAKLTLDQASVSQFASSAAGLAVGGNRLLNARVYQANDRPGYSPDAGITDLYAQYFNWMEEEKKRLAAHADYTAQAKETPGRAATILGGDVVQKSVLGAAGAL